MKYSELGDHWLTDGQLLDRFLIDLASLCRSGLPSEQKWIAREVVDKCKTERLGYDDAIKVLFGVVDNRMVRGKLREVVESFMDAHIVRECRKIRSAWDDSDMTRHDAVGKHVDLFVTEGVVGYRHNGIYSLG